MTKLFEKVLTFFLDILAFCLAFIIVFWVRYQSSFVESSGQAETFSGYLSPMVIQALIWSLLFLFFGLYRDWYKESYIQQIYVIAKIVTLILVLFFFLVSLDQIKEMLARRDFNLLFTSTKIKTFGSYWVCILVFVITARTITHNFMGYLYRRGIGRSKVLIVGANEGGQNIFMRIQEYKALGEEIIGFIDDHGGKKGTTFCGLPVMGTYSDIPGLVKKYSIESIIISQISSSHNEILKILVYCNEKDLTVKIVPDLFDVVSGHIKTEKIYGMPFMVLFKENMPPWQAQTKRLIDIFSSLIIGFGFWWFWGTVALLIKYSRWSSPGPALYIQDRIGKNGQPFRMVKFRTMIVDAEKKTGPVWAQKHDPRMTRIGGILRRFRIDELPQFWNIFKGEMSLVGPRPERKHIIDELLDKMPIYVRRLKMVPGLTGMAQVKHKYDASFDDVKEKVFYDLYYFENMSLAMDLRIMIRTIWVVISGRGAV
ncbi:MAG: sugar transferase [bacterium]